VIVEAAIKQDGKVWTLPPPARHHDIIKLIIEETGEMVNGEQGFVDDRGNFLNRVQAGQEAIGSGQLMSLPHPPKLYSEDLW
jgi:hypothetical protein